MNTTVGLEFSVSAEGSGDEGDFVFKGPGTTYLDVSGVFKDSLDKLYLKYDTKIEHLNDEDKKCLNLVTEYVEEMEATKNYELAYNIIADKFKDLDYPKHGTVGEYLAGCSKDKSGNPCFLHRISSIKKPGECCKSCVIEAIKTSSGLKFKKLNDGEGVCTVYIHCDDKNKFRGFSGCEKEELSKLIRGNKISIVGYDDNLQYYFVITEKPLTLAEIKSKGKCTKSNSSWWIFILIILVILALLYFFSYNFC